MEDSPRAARLIRFEAYRVDLQTGELYKNGQKVKLSGQPFEVLAMLLQRPGELVTREELQKKLWPQDTFVDFDHGLNTAINKIREALGDSAENPHYVETLPRRGYRFVADVGAGLAPAPIQSGPALEGRPRGAPLRKRWVAIAAVVVVVAVALGIASWLWFGRSGATTPEAPLAAVPLTSYPGIEESPSFSPDGTQVAFSWDGDKQDNFDIYVKLIGAEPPLRLTTHRAKENSPAWSPDGRWIAFIRVLPAGKAAVILISPIGGPERVLTEMYLDQITVDGPFLAWSPDSRWLAIVGANRPGEAVALFLYCVDTGEKRRLTSRQAYGWGDSCPAFSPDGRTLAFCRRVSWDNSDLFLLDLSQDVKPVAEPRRLTFGNWLAMSPAWTIDGRSLVFAAWPGGDYGLWRVAASGTSKPQRLAVIGANGASPAISRRGNRLAYAQVRWDFHIWRMEIPAAGGKAKPPEKFASSTRNEAMAIYSPDGKKVSFLSDRSGNTEVWACDADGSNPVQLTSLGTANIDSSPQWSPDSGRLTFSTNIEGHSEVYVLNASGGNPRRLTSNPTWASNPNWSIDGRWILFDSSSPMRGIYKVPAEGGPVVLVTTKGGYAPFESRDGKFIYSIENTADGRALQRATVEGGEPQRVLDHFADLQIEEDGVYFVPKGDPKSGYPLQFLNTATGKIQRIASFEKPIAWFAVSPDRRRILYTPVNQGGSDLMLVENFH